MNIPFLDLRKFKEPQNLLKYYTPWSFIMDDGVCLLKNGAVMATYRVEYPDLESSSAPEIASMASLFNRSAMTLSQNEGWALFFDVRRFKTKDYPAGEFSNLAGWLIDRKEPKTTTTSASTLRLNITSPSYTSFRATSIQRPLPSSSRRRTMLRKTERRAFSVRKETFLKSRRK